MAKDMDAIELLKTQHREVEELFDQLEQAEDADEKESLFAELADNLAVHAKIEEMHFYPAIRAKETEDLVLESLEEHLGVKRVMADLLDLDSEDETFQAKCKVLKEQVEHHVKEEEEELFPKVKKLLSSEELIALAQEMVATADELEDEEPRYAVRGETSAAPTT